MGSSAVNPTARPHDVPGPAGRRRARLRRLSLVALLLGLAGLAEMHGSWLQAWVASRIAGRLSYRVVPGPSPSIRFPAAGPYDERLGYTSLPEKLTRLKDRGFSVAAQARLSPTQLMLSEWGLSAIYPEKNHAGLRIEGRLGTALWEARHPHRVFRGFSDIPPVVVETLLFIENRELERGPPRRNPAIEWDRLAKALSIRMLTRDSAGGPGGSTLATQIEKYRHSPEGRTLSATDKLRQIGSASLRAYLGGPDTRSARQDIVLAYLNSVPLAAARGFGEVNGLGDGLDAWYGTELDEAVRLLSGPSLDDEIVARARVYKQILSLFVAERRPSSYLLEDRDGLRDLTDVYLSLLHEVGVIDGFLVDAALAVDLSFRAEMKSHPRPPFVETKATDAVRTDLLGLLDESRFYDLDRLDLVVRTTLDGEIQKEVIRALQSLADPKAAEEAGLQAPGLLARGDPSQVVYSLLLFERTSRGNALRVLADTLDRPFNVNEGMKLDLGSTAKLRTLVHYLDLVTRLHGLYAGRTPRELQLESAHPEDRIRRFVLGQLRARPDLPLPELLERALDRPYSADPGEVFQTGGGRHRFRNYDPSHDRQSFPIREALVHSVNLPFVRLMQDIETHLIFGPTGFAARLESDPEDPWRAEYLLRFAESESLVFLERFYAKHRERSPEDRIAALLGLRPSSSRQLAALHRSLFPDLGIEDLRRFLHSRGHDVSEARLERLHAQLGPEKLGLSDRAHLARLHPLELWMVGFLAGHPDATRREVITASRSSRREAYGWLFRTGRREAQNQRIRAVLEREVFDEIHRDWARLGYPFPSLVPSLATAIGVSADRPLALAELMGILQNDGRRLRERRVEALRFAPGTPYETVVEPVVQPGEQVIHPAVAQAVRGVLHDVVGEGTAQRLLGTFRGPGGDAILLAGKTGTGDSRHTEFSADGREIQSRVLSRAACFAFMLGERHFGVVSAFVDGSQAEDYAFTSALPLQVLRHLEPTLAPILREPANPLPPGRAAGWYHPAPLPDRRVRAPGRLGEGA